MKTEIYIHTCTCAARRNGDLAYISVFPLSFGGHECPTVQRAPVDLFRISCQSTCVPGTTPSILHSCSRPLIRRILVTMHSRYHLTCRCQCVTPPSLSQFESPPLSHTLRAPRSHILWEPPALTYFESPHITAFTASGSHVPTPHFCLSCFFLLLFFFPHVSPPSPRSHSLRAPKPHFHLSLAVKNMNSLTPSEAHSWEYSPLSKQTRLASIDITMDGWIYKLFSWRGSLNSREVLCSSPAHIK